MPTVVQVGGTTFEVCPTSVEADNGRTFYVEVTDALGQVVTSRVATLTVTPCDADENARADPLTLNWGVAYGAEVERRVEQFQPISWGLADASGNREDGGGLYGEGFQCPVRTHRGLDDEGRTYWIPFYDKSAMCSRGPLVNDLYNRYYWTQDGQGLRYQPLEELKLDNWTDGYDCGVPSPGNPPVVRSSQRINDDDRIVTRAYVYTYVSAYGEEGPPSDATLVTGVDSGTWELSELEVWPGDAKRRNLVRKNIYRSISDGGGGADYFYVGSVIMSVTTFKDNVPTSVVSNNNTLESLFWDPPPEDLTGLVAHPNGFFVGFVGRDLYFSEPYRPHAWPSNYILSTIGNIVGLGIYGTTIVICTNANPYKAAGIVPAAMTLSKHDTAEPCESRYGIVSMPFGVYYPGPNGLMLSSPNGVMNATQPLMTKEEWRNRYQPKAFDAARYQSQYVAFYDQHRGLMFAPDEPIAALVDLDLRNTKAGAQRQDSIFTDEYSGDTFIFDDCEMHLWNPTSGAPLDYDWTSKEFDTPLPLNFGAGRIIWYSRYTPPSEEKTQEWRDYNTARMADMALNPLNSHAIGMTRREPTGIDRPPGWEGYPEFKMPFHWSPLIWLPYPGDKWPNTPYVILDVIANEKLVYSREITHTKQFRLPTGFKATRWMFRLRSNIPIQSAKIATTGKELASV